MKILIYLLVTVSTLWITALYVKLSEEKDTQTIGYSNLLKWHTMASSPPYLCRARGGEYRETAWTFDFKSRNQETSWACIDDKH